jgi:hypothetical protein
MIACFFFSSISYCSSFHFNYTGFCSYLEVLDHNIRITQTAHVLSISISYTEAARDWKITTGIEAIYSWA